MKKIIKGIVASLMATVMSTSAFAQISNSGFETTTITDNRNYQQFNESKIEGWKTTATSKKIELFGINKKYMFGTEIQPCAGINSCELDSDEQSSIYQYVNLEGAKSAEWSFYHRGRCGEDTMLLVIGPRQSVDPSKTSSTGVDQFMVMGEFLNDYPVETEIVIYSSPFSKKGTFVTDGFSFEKTETYTEEWHIWKVTSGNDGWHKYAGKYGVKQSATIFALSAYSMAVRMDNGVLDKTYGNLVDEIYFNPEFVIPDYKIINFENQDAYIFGYNDSIMAPENDVIRGEVSAMIYRLVKQNKRLQGFVYDENEEACFGDINGQWFRSAIEYLNYLGAFENAKFVYPYRSITRGEAFKLICLGLGFTKDNSLDKLDYGLILKDAGMIVGYEDGTLGEKNTMSRAEFCTMYNRIIGRENAGLETEDGTVITPATYGFTDIDENEWYYAQMLRATSAYNDEGYVDLAKRGIRNVLDDYK